VPVGYQEFIGPPSIGETCCSSYNCTGLRPTLSDLACCVDMSAGIPAPIGSDFEAYISTGLEKFLDPVVVVLDTLSDRVYGCGGTNDWLLFDWLCE
jgi:hypothetical protein